MGRKWVVTSLMKWLQYLHVCGNINSPLQSTHTCDTQPLWTVRNLQISERWEETHAGRHKVALAADSYKVSASSLCQMEWWNPAWLIWRPSVSKGADASTVAVDARGLRCCRPAARQAVHSRISQAVSIVSLKETIILNNGAGTFSCCSVNYHGDTAGLAKPKRTCVSGTTTFPLQRWHNTTTPTLAL